MWFMASKFLPSFSTLLFVTSRKLQESMVYKTFWVKSFQ